VRDITIEPAKPQGAHEEAGNDEYDRSGCCCTFDPTSNQAIAEDKQSENGKFDIHVNSSYAWFNCYFFLTKLNHTSLESTVCYPGVEVEAALRIMEQVEL
jgi:hypothetical protein